MSLTSLGFILFIALFLGLYYWLPKRFQNKILLLANIFFYCSFGMGTVGYIIVTTITIFFTARKIETLQKSSKKRKRILVLTLMLNFGLLAFVKYTNFLIHNIDSLFAKLQVGYQIPGMNILLPIGISFYTFQATGYLLDVYWKREQAENNIWKFASFVSFFPQIIQGPISKHKDLAPQLNSSHQFNFMNLKYGIQLIIWGYFKKLVIADTSGVVSTAVFSNPTEYQGLAVIVGVLAYCIQLYCDFSGGIDVVRGVAQLFDIHIVDNFKRPFFSQSIAEFWRRWHITLGIWMKDYAFYPMALSKNMNKLGKSCQKLFGRKTGRKIPICLENLIIFFLVGVWHGASWHFIVYGLYNGFIIAISSLLEPLYDKLFSITHINPKAKLVKVWRIIRTFILVNIGWYFDNTKTLQDSWILLKNTFLPTNVFYDGSAFLGLLKYQYIYVLFGCIILFIVSVLQEKGIQIREKIDTLPFLLKFALWITVIFLIPLLGLDPQSEGGFMYANF